MTDDERWRVVALTFYNAAADLIRGLTHLERACGRQTFTDEELDATEAGLSHFIATAPVGLVYALVLETQGAHATSALDRFRAERALDDTRKKW